MAKFDSKTFNPEAFGRYVEMVPKTKRNELLRSGVIKPNGDVRDAFSSQTGAYYTTIPMFGRIGGEALNYDGATNITSDSTTTFEQGVIVVGRAKAWTERDFSQDITGGTDFMGNVARQVSSYWEEIYQDTLLSILKGIYSMTGAENKKFVDNHTLDITGEEGEAGNIGITTLNTATQKACGDNKSIFSVVIMHSVVATNLENLRLLKNLTITDENGITREIGMATWNGKTVFIDDSMPTKKGNASGTPGAPGYIPAHTQYTTYVLGEGAFSFEDIGAKVPFEMERNPSKNGGEDTLYSRRRYVYAPYGISYTKTSQASLSPTKAELETASNWEVVNDGNTTYLDHKAIPIARIITRG